MDNKFLTKLEFTIGDTTFHDIQGSGGYKISWSYDCKLNDSFNFLKIRIYNIEKTKREMFQKGDTYTFSFGYNNNIMEYSKGEVYEIETKREGLNVATDFYCQQAIIPLKFRYSKSYGAGTKASTILQDIANQNDLVIKRMDLLEDKIFNGGYVCHDYTVNLASKLTDNCGSFLKINGNELTISNANSNTDYNNPVILDYRNGLLKSVSKILRNVKPSNRATRQAKRQEASATHNVRCLADPQIEQLDVITINDGENINSRVKVLSISIIDYVCDLEVQVLE